MLQVNDILGGIVSEFFDFIFDNFDSIIDAILPPGISMDDLRSIAPSNGPDTQLAFTVNEELIGFFVNAPSPAGLQDLIGPDLNF